MLDGPAWEERYRSRPAVWSKRPNPQLVAEAGDFPVGTALDAGCGEGADARWLAGHGWQVTAVDFSATALQRGAEQAEALGADLAARIRWVPADLSDWDRGEQRFDLVSAQFIHLPAPPRQAVFARLAAAVAPGGTLLIVGHHPSDLQTPVRRPPLPEAFYTAEQAADCLEPHRWDVHVCEARPRGDSGPDGQPVTVHDTVLRARKRR